MRSHIRKPYLRGRPIPVDFLGFRSDTHELQRRGWQIVEEEDPYRQEIRLLIKHSDHHISGQSGTIKKDQLFSWGFGHNSIEGPRLVITLAIQYLRAEYGSMSRFSAVDTTPRYIEEPRMEDLYDAPYFQPIGEGKEIFLKEASVDEIMQIALDKQEPEQAEIRARKKREEWKRGGQTKARLIMVA